MKSARVLGTLIAIAIALVACSGDVSFSFGGETADEAAVTLIEGQEMQDQLNIGAITDALCDKPPTEDVGTFFACTADSTQGPIDFEVEIDREDHIFAVPQNVISQEAQGLIAADLAASLNDQLNLEISATTVDCGDRVIVFPASSDPLIPCQVTMPDTSDVHDADVTVTNVETGTFDVDFGLGFEAVVARAVISGQETRELLNIGPLTNIACDEPTSKDVGTLFSCTADSEQGPIDYQVEIDRPAHIIANPINVILQPSQRNVATEAARVLNEQYGSTLPDDAIDCGDQARVIRAGEAVLDCALTSNESGAIYDATITITDPDTGAFVVDVADTPRN